MGRIMEWLNLLQHKKPGMCPPEVLVIHTDWLLISVSGSSQFVRGPNKCIRLNYGEIDTAAIDAAGIKLAGLVKPVLQLSEKSKHDCCFGNFAVPIGNYFWRSQSNTQESSIRTRSEAAIMQEMHPCIFSYPQ
ncbi:hypothetical protein UY3_00286 [Chelonia mydas]|uniref:Uncharacterized protein n=1 Tax=Chelonia mydas TaxID=8469 RepID=M7CMJ0_CHEMY|nr:hypothetical protein UY3_00286 [Chelonia mydas]